MMEEGDAGAGRNGGAEETEHGEEEIRGPGAAEESHADWTGEEKEGPKLTCFCLLVYLYSCFLFGVVLSP